MNTTDSVGKQVRRLTELGDEEAAAAPRHRAPKEEDNRYTVTSRLYEEDLISEDAEVLHVLPAHGWVAAFESRRVEPLVAWAVLEDDRGYGVTLEDGKLNVSSSVEDKPGFVGYEKREV